MKPESRNKRPSRCLSRLVRRLRCGIVGHRTYSYKATGEFAITRDEDDMATAQCVVCGEILRAPCGLMLPGFKLGTAPILPPNAQVEARRK